MRHLCACLVVLAFVPLTPAEGPSLKDARARWLKGNYEEAHELYQKLAQDSAQREAAALGISRTWQSQGEYDRALAGVEEALTAAPKSPALQARRAELLYLRGRWDEAEKAAEEALRLDKEN